MPFTCLLYDPDTGPYIRSRTSEETRVRIAVFGATGRTGRQIVQYAVDNEVGVKALARDSRVVAPQPGLEVVEGDVLDPGAVFRTVHECDAVAMAVGPAKHTRPTVCSEATEIILQVMQKLNVTRIVAVSALGVGDSREQLPPLRKLLARTLWRGFLEDKERQEHLIRQSDTEWVVVRPGRLSENAHTREPHTGIDQSTVAGTVGRAQVAQFVVEQLLRPSYVHQFPHIT
jgi:putative NADH-flavin reductase